MNIAKVKNGRYLIRKRYLLFFWKYLGKDGFWVNKVMDEAPYDRPYVKPYLTEEECFQLASLLTSIDLTKYPNKIVATSRFLKLKF